MDRYNVPSVKSLVEYETDSGKSPFSHWLKRLRDRKGQAIILARLRRFALTGNAGDHKHVGFGVWELRIDFGPGYRVYYGEEGESIILLLLGGDKSSQSKDIRAAQDYWHGYRSRL